MATYPKAIKVFATYHDYSDVIFSASVNDIHDEVISVEKTLGTTPFDHTPYNTFGSAVQDLFLNKAPVTHVHQHHNLQEDDLGDDHPQYIRTDGTRPFSGPVGGQWAVAGNQLVPLSQLQSFNLISVIEAEYIAAVMTGGLVQGVYGGAPLVGLEAPAPTWKLTGGLWEGSTDGAGQIYVPFGYPGPSPFVGTIQGFVATKLPVGGGHARPPYNYVEAQLTLMGISLYGAVIKFSHDYDASGAQAYLWVAFSWICIGT